MSDRHGPCATDSLAALVKFEPPTTRLFREVDGVVKLTASHLSRLLHWQANPYLDGDVDRLPDDLPVGIA